MAKVTITQVKSQIGQPERAQGTAMPLGLPDLGSDLGDAQSRH